MSDKFLNIFLISSDWENNHRKGLHSELNKQLSQWSKTVFVEYPYSILIHTFIRFKGRFLKTLSEGRTKKYGSVNIFTPIILFHDKIWKKSNLAYKIDSYLVERQLSKFIKKNYPGHFVILWVSFPYHYLLSKNFRHDLLIYDYYDNYSFDLDGTFNNVSDEFNISIIKDSQIILCTAMEMYRTACTYNNSAHYIPNGHNFDLEQIRNTERIKLIENADIIGYLGNIRDWIDFSLIDKILEKLKENQYVVFVGPVEKNVSGILNRLKSKPRFLHIDKVPYEDTWKYIKGFDIGIIPFKINKFTEGVLPYKFYEYIACGIPVVATALPDLKQFSGIINVCSTDTEFADKCINRDSPLTEKYNERYLEIAENSTWNKRAEQINNLVKDKLNFISSADLSKNSF